MEYQDQIIVESIKAEIKELINTAHNHEEKILPKEQNLMQRYFSTLDETQDDEQFQEEVHDDALPDGVVHNSQTHIFISYGQLHVRI